jgi:hypothetical protein
MPRSKSTPGLLESSGKVPLEAMLLTRYNTLPAGVLTPQSSQEDRDSTMHSHSHCPSSRGLDDVSLPGSNSRPPSPAQSDGDGGDDSNTGGLAQAASADMTHSITVSSITSYVTDHSSAQKSPVVTEAPTGGGGRSSRGAVGLSPSHSLNRAASPSAVLGSSSQTPAMFTSDAKSMPLQTFTSLPPLSAFGPASGLDYSSATLPSATGRQQPQTLYGGSVASPQTLQVGSSGPGGATSTTAAVLSPFHMPYPQQQQQPLTTTSSGGLLLSSYPPHAHQSASNLMGSSSLGSLPKDPSQEILLQEITRLRERLVALETENATMSMKLHQQHWEVESRLAEIEMHMCGSDSMASGGSDDKPCSGNKESVI